MENYPIKSVTFGGFDKQSVIEYIERTSQEATAAQEALQEENERLRQQLEESAREAEELSRQVVDLTARQEQMQEELKQEAAARQSMERLRPLEEEAAQLRAELQALQPDAQAYAQIRERIGAIECEARKRAADLEGATAAQMRKTVELFRAQYQALMSTFETTASYVTGELRKVEVNLSQLPRAMDRSGAEFNELAALLDKPRREE
ncbi:hypothetical protein [Oscillibacter sp.]|uniref:hypothetical protein n=1 Tax=Oscillibacter sp. TaxID=1945593 RepID=UPI0026292544|nr:hypothetical protein [Oscillibacter sp.]MDD3347524.1 hypothetical protein [Oscillibacter sp.]